MTRSAGPPRAAIFGCAGLSLTDAEKSFFRDSNPLGFILFSRNVATPDQVRTLVTDLRSVVEDAAAPVLIDQEGGRVQRLGPPHWPARPRAAVFADQAVDDPVGAASALARNASAIARDLRALGITVDCWPVLDLPQPDADPIIGDRAFGTDTATIARLGGVVCDALLAEGVTPVIKHIPGHGRATIDSHKALPMVTADRETLKGTDFKPFADLTAIQGGGAWAMTAHVVYSAIDANACATFSTTVVNDVIRRELGFDGLLLTDDLSMGALSGDFGDRTQQALVAGCDVVLHCNGEMAEMAAIASSLPVMTDAALVRLSVSEARRTEGQRTLHV